MIKLGFYQDFDIESAFSDQGLHLLYMYGTLLNLTSFRLNRLPHTIYWKGQVSNLGMSGYVISLSYGKAVVRLSVCLVFTFSNVFSSGTTGPIEFQISNFMWSLHGMGERKFAYGVQVT